ncbi:unnamed protein product [Caenorhabditis brenneri]
MPTNSMLSNKGTSEDLVRGSSANGTKGNGLKLKTVCQESSGKKDFYFAKPTKENLDLFKKYEKNRIGGNKWLGRRLKGQWRKMELEAGDKLFTPLNSRLDKVYKFIYGCPNVLLKKVPTVKDEPYLGVSFECMPYRHGTRPIDVELLSGGEKKVASVAFFLALNLVKGSPFLVLDELDKAFHKDTCVKVGPALQKLGKEMQIVAVCNDKHMRRAFPVHYHEGGVEFEMKSLDEIHVFKGTALTVSNVPNYINPKKRVTVNKGIDRYSTSVGELVTKHEVKPDSLTIKTKKDRLSEVYDDPKLGSLQEVREEQNRRKQMARWTA